MGSARLVLLDEKLKERVRFGLWSQFVQKLMTKIYTCTYSAAKGFFPFTLAFNAASFFVIH